LKRFVEGRDRRQGVLLPEYLDDYVSEENPVRAVEAFTAELDLAALGFAGVVAATENRIRDGADAAMGYPRFGMLDLLKLLSGLLVGLFRSHAAREAETAFLRQQLVVLKRSAPAHRFPTT
jgi:hypothetical protein